MFKIIEKIKSELQRLSSREKAALAHFLIEDLLGEGEPDMPSRNTFPNNAMTAIHYAAMPPRHRDVPPDLFAALFCGLPDCVDGTRLLALNKIVTIKKINYESMEDCHVKFQTEPTDRHSVDPSRLQRRHARYHFLQ